MCDGKTCQPLSSKPESHNSTRRRWLATSLWSTKTVSVYFNSCQLNGKCLVTTKSRTKQSYKQLERFGVARLSDTFYSSLCISQLVIHRSCVVNTNLNPSKSLLNSQCCSEAVSDIQCVAFNVSMHGTFFLKI